jgi:hypothetical protein
MTRRVVLGGVVGGFIALAGCSTDEPQLEVGAVCSTAGECTAPLVCVLDHCRYRCPSSDACPLDTLASGEQAPERCLQMGGISACIPASDQACPQGADDCAEGLVCAADGLCRNDCAISRECVLGQVCMGGVCMEPPEPTDDAGDDTTTGDDGGGNEGGAEDGGGNDAGGNPTSSDAGPDGAPAGAIVDGAVSG